MYGLRDDLVMEFNVPNPMKSLDSVFNNVAFEEPERVNDSDTVTVTITLQGMDARWIITEASARGVTYAEMVKILVQQGMFTWTRKL